MNNKLTTFDTTKYLDSNEVIAEYLSQILKDNNLDELLDAICEIARAKGMSQIDKHAALEILNNFKEPNAKTKQAMKEADKKIGKTISYDEFIKEIEADDT